MTICFFRVYHYINHHYLKDRNLGQYGLINVIRMIKIPNEHSKYEISVIIDLIFKNFLISFFNYICCLKMFKCYYFKPNHFQVIFDCAIIAEIKKLQFQFLSLASFQEKNHTWQLLFFFIKFTDVKIIVKIWSLAAFPEIKRLAIKFTEKKNWDFIGSKFHKLSKIISDPFYQIYD